MDDATRNKAIEEGLAIKELQRQEGWNVLKKHIDVKVRGALADIRRIELEGRNLQDIGAEYVSQVKLIDGLEAVLEIVKDIESRHEEAVAEES